MAPKPKEKPGKAAKPKSRMRLRGWGGAVYLKPDPKVFTLDHIAKLGAIDAPAGSAASEPNGEPGSGADRIVPIPVGTMVYNAQKRDCNRACRWETADCKKNCTTKKGVEILPSGKLYHVAAGGDCGNGQGERHKINLRGKPFQTAKSAIAYVKSLGYPWILVEDAAKTTRTVKFIVKMPPEDAQRFMKRQSRSSPYNISARYEVFRAKWRDLERRGSQLVFKRTLRGYPKAHEVVKDKGQARLRPVALGATLAIESSRVIKADITQLLRLPKDTYLLEVGVKPTDMWFEPFVPGVPIFSLLLLAFVILNLLAIRAYFRG